MVHLAILAMTWTGVMPIKDNQYLTTQLYRGEIQQGQ